MAGGGLAGCSRPEPGVNSYAFVANSEGKAVAVIDLAVFTLAGRIALAADPTEVLASPSRRTIYALTAADGYLYEINVARRQVFRRLQVGVGARGMRVSGDQTLLCLATPHEVVFVGRQEMKVMSRLRMPAPVVDFDVSPETSHATCSLGSGEVAVIDVATRSVLRRAKLSSAAGTLRFLKNGQWIMVGLPQERLLSVVATASGQLVVDLPLAIRPDRFCFSGDLGQMFVTGEGADAVAIVYPFQSQVAATLLAGHQPGAMAASRNPAYLFVANPTSNAVTVIDVPAQRVVGAVPVGQEPGHIIMTPDDQFALVLNRSSGDMAVLSTSRFAKVVRRDRSAPMFHLVPVGISAGECGDRDVGLEQAEVDFYVGGDRDGTTVFEAWAEAPLHDGFDGLFVETEAEGADDTKVARIAFFVDDDGEEHSALELSLASFFGIFRFDFQDDGWGRDAAADLVGATAGVAAGAGAKAGSTAGADTATRAGADAAAGSGAVGGHLDAGQRVTDVGHVDLGQIGVRLDDQGRFHDEFRLGVIHDGHGRGELPRGDLGEFAFAGRGGRTIATATAAAHGIFLLRSGLVSGEVGRDEGDGLFGELLNGRTGAEDNQGANYQDVEADGGEPVFAHVFRAAPDVFDRDGLGGDLEGG